MISASFDLVARIVREGLTYANLLGFEPHPDYHDAALLLEGANPEDAPEEVPLGIDGRPNFISGPYDNVPKILRQLEKSVGPGNFHFPVGVGALESVLEGLGDEGWEADVP
jgi:hypothetical protein